MCESLVCCTSEISCHTPPQRSFLINARTCVLCRWAAVMCENVFCQNTERKRLLFCKGRIDERSRWSGVGRGLARGSLCALRRHAHGQSLKNLKESDSHTRTAWPCSIPSAPCSLFFVLAHSPNVAYTSTLFTNPASSQPASAERRRLAGDGSAARRRRSTAPPPRRG